MNIYQLPKNAEAAQIRNAFSESVKDLEAIVKVLKFDNTPIDVLVDISLEHLAFNKVSIIAPLLESHPGMTDEVFVRIITGLKTRWWGEDPTEYRIAWTALENSREARLAKF